MEAVILAKGLACKKTVPLRVPYCKLYIKPMAGTKLLYFGVTKDKISTFVV